MSWCHLHGNDCFVNWKSLEGRRISEMPTEHIPKHRLTDNFDEPVIGPATAIARVHTLLQDENYPEADELKLKYHISVYPDGYIAWGEYGI